MKKIVMYTRLSNERDLASQTENEGSVELDESMKDSERTDEEENNC